jgi:hypothetical protein
METTTTKTTIGDADQPSALQMSLLILARTRKVTMSMIKATRKSLPTHPSSTWTATTNSLSPDALAQGLAVSPLVAQ